MTSAPPSVIHLHRGAWESSPSLKLYRSTWTEWRDSPSSYVAILIPRPMALDEVWEKGLVHKNSRNGTSIVTKGTSLETPSFVSTV